MTKFNENRTFGVEIEFQGSREEVARLMNLKGVNTEVEEYNHTTKGYWKLVTDAFCGYELVSPILKGREGLRQLKIACEALNEAGVTVDRRCGLHVHHDVNDYSVKQITNIFALYVKLEETIDTLMPQSRRRNNNTYCQSLFGYRSQQDILNRLKEVKVIEDIGNIWSSRYVKVNFQSYIKYGTIEFRQHSGTIEFEKMYNWILITQQIVERAQRTVKYSYEEAPSNTPLLTLQRMLKIIASQGADEEIANMANWFRGRAKQLAAA